MCVYDVAVVGGGPAGIMAAIRAGQLYQNVVLLERNDYIGKKILLTGQGRCNISNAATMATFVEQFGKQGSFLRTAFSSFFNQELIRFFEVKGLNLKVERQGRIFPVTNRAYSILRVLKVYLSESQIKVLYNTQLLGIKKKGSFFQLIVKGKLSLKAKKVILATGGASYKQTGSTGDGFHIARKMGHTVVPLKPALVPLKVKESWIKDLKGLALKNIRITFFYGKRKIVSEVGELMFTHFGVSGPLVLDLSGKIISIMESHKDVKLSVDLKPGLKIQKVEDKLLNLVKVKGNMQLKNIIKTLLPQRLIPVIIRLAGLAPAKVASQISRQERQAITALLKNFSLSIVGSLPIEEAMITNGGVATREINPRSMESKIVPGLYFAGEIIDGYASSGGYNLQQAFSTGYLAGTSVSKPR